MGGSLEKAFRQTNPREARARSEFREGISPLRLDGSKTQWRLFRRDHRLGANRREDESPRQNASPEARRNTASGHHIPISHRRCAVSNWAGFLQRSVTWLSSAFSWMATACSTRG